MAYELLNKLLSFAQSATGRSFSSSQQPQQEEPSTALLDLSSILNQIAPVLPSATIEPTTPTTTTTRTRPACPWTWYSHDAALSNAFVNDLLKFQIVPAADAFYQAFQQFNAIDHINRNIVNSKFDPKVSHAYPQSSRYISPHGLAITDLIKRLQLETTTLYTSFTVVFPRGSSDASTTYPRGIGDGTVYGAFTALDCPAGSARTRLPAHGICVCSEEQNLAHLPKSMMDRLAIQVVMPAPVLLSPDTVKDMIAQPHTRTDIVLCDVLGLCDDITANPFDGVIVKPSTVVRFAILHTLHRVTLRGTLIFVLNAGAWDPVAPGRAQVVYQLVHALAARFDRFTTWTSSLSQATFLIFHELSEQSFAKSQVLASVATEDDEGFLSSIMTPRHAKHATVIQQNLNVAQGRWCEYATSQLQYQIFLAGSLRNSRLPDAHFSAIRADYDKTVSVATDRYTPLSCGACRAKAPSSVMEKDMWQTMSAVMTKTLRLQDHTHEGQCKISAALALQDQSEGGGWRVGAVGFRVRTGGKLGALILGFGDDDSEVRLAGCTDGIIMGEERVALEPAFCKGVPRPFVADIVYYEDTCELAILDVWIAGGMPEVLEEKRGLYCLRHAPIRAVYAMNLAKRMAVREEVRAHVTSMKCVVNVNVSWPVARTSNELKTVVGLTQCLNTSDDDDLYVNLCDGRKDSNVERRWDSWRVWRAGSWICENRVAAISVAAKPSTEPKKRKPSDMLTE